METTELWRLSAGQLRTAYAAKDTTPREVTEATLAHIAERDGELGAIVTVDAEGARRDAAIATETWRSGNPPPLCGVPLTVKDLIFTKGLRTAGGSRRFADFVPDVDAAVVERVRAAGAVVLGKSATCELGHKFTGDSELFGLCRNPWDTSRTTGGSSGGAGAALAAGFGPLALATDALGSIRVPSAFCGVFGIKPTYGVVPRAPGFAPPSWDSLAHTGPMARTVADAALLLAQIAGSDSRDRMSIDAPVRFTYDAKMFEAIAGEPGRALAGLRVGFSPDLGYAAVDVEVAALVARAVGAFGECGARIEFADPGFSDPLDEVLYPIGMSELRASRASDSAQERALLDSTLRDAIAATPEWTAVDYVRAGYGRNAIWRAMNTFFETNDVLVTPTVAIPAFVVGEIGVDTVAGRSVQKHLGWSPFTFPFNLCGLPAASLPCGLTASGLPVGLQLVGPRFAEGLILRAAAAFEAVRPWPLFAPPSR